MASGVPNKSTWRFVMERLLNASDVARKLGIPVRQIHYHARMGNLPAVRLGRAVRFVESRVDRWMAEGGCGSAETARVAERDRREGLGADHE
jgi:excisionase family DNA binding protein